MHRARTVHPFNLDNLPEAIVLLFCCPMRCRVAELVPHFTPYANKVEGYVDKNWRLSVTRRGWYIERVVFRQKAGFFYLTVPYRIPPKWGPHTSTSHGFVSVFNLVSKDDDCPPWQHGTSTSNALN